MEMKFTLQLLQPYLLWASELTHLVLRPEYSMKIRTISWILVTWSIVSPGHQQLWYGLCKLTPSLSFTNRQMATIYAVSQENMTQICFGKGLWRNVRAWAYLYQLMGETTTMLTHVRVFYMSWNKQQYRKSSNWSKATLMLMDEHLIHTCRQSSQQYSYR